MATGTIDELAAAIARHARTDGPHETALRQLHLFRRSAPSEWVPVMYGPALFMIAQGSKIVQLADITYRYDSAQYLLSSVDVPVMCRVSRASARAPYLALRFELDPVVVGELLVGGAGPQTARPPERGVVVTPVEPLLLDTMLRLVSLLDTPADIAVLAPLMLRELTYRVLTGPQGARLRQIAAAGAPAERIARATCWIRDHSDEPLRIAGLARRVGMGLSAFHLHFKTITGMSPLQFQKSLRLQEARQLMVAGLTAAEAAFRVGYESPSHFSRDYRRAFGAPPRQSAVTLRSSAPSAV